MYVYPNHEEGYTVFDEDELNSDALLVICVKATHEVNDAGVLNDRHKIYIWHGKEFEEDDEDEMSSVKTFVSNCMEKYWGCPSPEQQYNILEIDVYEDQESDEFNDLFY